MQIAKVFFLTSIVFSCFLDSSLDATDYPYQTAEPQKTGWPLTAEERAYVVDKPEHERRPGRESNKHLPAFWPLIPSAGHWGGTSWLDTHAKLVDYVRANQGPIDVLLVGDSITQQWGSPLDKGVLNDPWNKHFSGYKTINIGIGGDKSQNILWRLDHGGVDGLEPRLVVLMIGNNNMFFTPETGIEAAAKGVQMCVANVRKRFSKADVIVVKILPCHAPGNTFYEDIKKTNAALDPLKLDSDPQVHVLDLTSNFVNLDGTLNRALYGADNIHLSLEGYGVYAQELKPLIDKSLGDKGVGSNIIVPVQKTTPIARPLEPTTNTAKPTSETANAKIQKITVGRPPFTMTADEAAHHQVKVVEPDGSIAKQISVSPLSTDIGANVELTTMEQNANTRGEKLGPDGTWILDLSNPEQFFFIKSEKGCLLLSGTRILATDHLDLLAWSSVRVKIVYGGKPMANMKVSCGTELTSDRMFQTPDISVSAMTDESGTAEFDRFLPGESSIRINPQPAEFQGKKWVWLDQKRYVTTVPGEQLEVTFGKGARDVVGRFVFDKDFDDGIQEYWGANLEYSSIRNNMGGNSETKVRIKISQNGSFIAESAPPGEAKIIIQHPGVQPKARGIRIGQGLNIKVGPDQYIGPQMLVVGPVRINEGGDKAELQDLGDIRLDFKRPQRPMLDRISDYVLSNPAPVASADDFTSKETIAFIARVKREGKVLNAFLDQRGQVIRTLSEYTPSFGDDATVDQKNQRVYLICNVPDAAPVQELRAFDLSGRQLYARPLERGANYAIATDTDNGRIGLLKSKGGKSALQLLQPDGVDYLTVDVVSSLRVCYSSVDKAFWLSQSTQITKLNATNLNVLASFQPPPKIRCHNAIPLRSGGVVAIERSSVQTLSSSNRIWKLDSAAQLVGVVDLGEYAAGECIDLGSSLLVRAHKIKGLRSPSESAAQSCWLLVDHKMKNMSRFYSLADVSKELVKASGVWVMDGRMLRRVIEVENELIITASQSIDEEITSAIALGE